MSKLYFLLESGFAREVDDFGDLRFAKIGFSSSLEIEVRALLAAKGVAQYSALLTPVSEARAILATGVLDVVVTANEAVARDVQDVAKVFDDHLDPVTFSSRFRQQGTADSDFLYGSRIADELVGLGSGDSLDGQAGNDLLNGGDGNDFLKGGAGADKLVGGRGSDTASYADSPVRVTVNLAKPTKNKADAKGDTYSSVENLVGSSHNDRLFGDKQDNRIEGGRGNDYLAGAKGGDVLAGGDGADIFAFKGIADSTRKSKGRDVITDFDPFEGDKLDLSVIDAKAGSRKNDKFRFIGDDAFSGRKGELRFESGSKKTFVYGDVDGDKIADIAIELSGKITLQKADFVL